MPKKRIGITQKVMKHPVYPEVLSCLDVKWFDLLVSYDMIPIPIALTTPKLAGSLITEQSLDGIIFSGGNSLSECAINDDDQHTLSHQRDQFEHTLLRAAIGKDLPVLGICRGLQLINNYFGGAISPLKQDTTRRHPLIAEKNTPWTWPSEVNSYHDYVVKNNSIGDHLQPLAFDPNGHIEALRHAHKKILAIMWHPEREQPSNHRDQELIQAHFQS
jgi:gamma-glutamyl-gamma-aminobutyrate hydrolase PuuD